MVSRFMAASRAKALRKNESSDDQDSLREDLVGTADEEAALMVLMQRYMKISDEKRREKGHSPANEALAKDMALLRQTLTNTGAKREPAEQNAAAIEMAAAKEEEKNGDKAPHGESQKRGNGRNRGRRAELEMDDSEGHGASSRVPPPAKRSRRVEFSPDNAKHRHAKKEPPRENKSMQEQLKAADREKKGGRFSPRSGWSVFSRSSFSLSSRSSGRYVSPQAKAESGRREKDMRELHMKLAKEREARMDLEMRLAKERAARMDVRQDVEDREQAPQKRDEHGERTRQKRDENIERAALKMGEEVVREAQKRGKEGEKKQRHIEACEGGVKKQYDAVAEVEPEGTHHGTGARAKLKADRASREAAIQSEYAREKKKEHEERRREQKSPTPQRGAREDEKAQKRRRDDEKAKKEHHAKKDRYAQPYKEETQRGTREDGKALRKTREDEKAKKERYAALQNEVEALRSELGGLRKGLTVPDKKNAGCFGCFSCGEMACLDDRDDTVEARGCGEMACLDDRDNTVEARGLSRLANSFTDDATEDSNSRVGWVGSRSGSGEGTEVGFMDGSPVGRPGRHYGRHASPRRLRGPSHRASC